MGYGEDYLEFLAGERASEQAVETIALLRPRLRPGLRLLDLGCGPGQVTAVLAEAVAPGETWGIDMEPSQVELARTVASERGGAHARFEVADAAELPFGDGSFDVVTCLDLLAYVPDTSRVLAEVRRVLKPGGTLFCREMVIDSSFAYPNTEIIDRGWQIFADLLESDDGHPQMGKELGLRLLDGGFSDVSQRMTFETYAEETDVERFYRLVTGWFLGSEIRQAAQQYGVQDEHEAQRLAEQMQVWRSTPGALAALAFGEALATRP
ncbi:MAG: methyltransferase domain-containing protein [Chloroflexi bacterium]|nr:methyltransferase domain-containing protein [Chloroflexota bacterium]